jgi:hypothetical protein
MNETHEQRIERKATDLRAALLAAHIVWSPDPECPFTELPEARKENWRKLARAYVEIFG